MNESRCNCRLMNCKLPYGVHCEHHDKIDMVAYAKGNRRFAIDKPAGRIEFGREVFEQHSGLRLKEKK